MSKRIPVLSLPEPQLRPLNMPRPNIAPLLLPLNEPRPLLLEPDLVPRQPEPLLLPLPQPEPLLLPLPQPQPILYYPFPNPNGNETAVVIYPSSNFRLA